MLIKNFDFTRAKAPLGGDRNVLSRRLQTRNGVDCFFQHAGELFAGPVSVLTAGTVIFRQARTQCEKTRAGERARVKAMRRRGEGKWAKAKVGQSQRARELTSQGLASQRLARQVRQGVGGQGQA